MGLQLYRKKRNFKDTPEPAGKKKESRSKLTFVIQRHKASHLHYDFRLEMEGVLKSWAVPKGPSMNPSDKRLAMMVEDHPYDYGSFEGIIPEGNYGAGIVEIWDQGEYSDLDQSDKKTAERKLLAGLHAGQIKIRMKGKKLKGEFVLVKTHGRGENAWLLIKHNDEHAVHEPYNAEEHTPMNSPINKWLKQHGKKVAAKGLAARKKARVRESSAAAVADPDAGISTIQVSGRKLSHYVKPMLARETDQPFSDSEWIYEMKWDGFRAIAEVAAKEVKLYSRNGNSFAASFPELIKELKRMKIKAVLDGEIIVVDEQGRSSFQKLQYYQSENAYPLEYRVFDLLELNGKNICGLPLLKRKEKLRKLLEGKSDLVKYSDHIEENGIDFFRAAAENDLEGIIAKRADSLYKPGERTREWLKIKNHKTTEAIIAGFTEPSGGRKFFGALVLGIMSKGKLKYIGNTGSGFTEDVLREVSELMKPLIQKNSPFDEKVKARGKITWVKPVLVCEIKYAEWTRDGRLRIPIFLRLRDDKKASEVTMGIAKPLHAPRDADEVAEMEKLPLKKARAKKAARKKHAGSSDTRQTTAKKVKEDSLRFGRISVKLSNLEKLYFPEEKITKGDVIRYYQSVSSYILPFLKDRPQSLLRNPNGILDKGFFHKDAGDKAPDWVKSEKIYSESTDKDIDYIICNNAATLAYLNNLGCIELNPWHSTIRHPDQPDYLIIDIDPSDNNTFDQVIEAANVVHDILKRAGTEGYCKTSGASGLHIYVPANKKYTYDQLKDFTHLICMMACEELPEFTTLERNLRKRGKDRIYMDYLQNRRGQTISSVYSLRPKPGATVSMPLRWNEVKPGLSPQDFTIYNALDRIEKYPGLFTGVLGKGLDLEKCLKRLSA